MNHLLLIYSIICFIAAPLPTAAARHVYPDNYIDRTLSVLVRNRTVQIEYSVALNDATIECLIRQWKSPSLSAESERQTSSLNQSFEAKAATNQPAAIPAPSGTELNVSPASEETFENDAELVAAFRKLVAEKISKGLHVTCKGKPITIREINRDLPAAYHMSVTVQFEFTLPADKATDLSIADDNFLRFDGGARYALKAAGNAVLTRSNVAPILVRAKRIEFADLPQDTRREACLINAQIVQTQGP